MQIARVSSKTLMRVILIAIPLAVGVAAGHWGPPRLHTYLRAAGVIPARQDESASVQPDAGRWHRTPRVLRAAEREAAGRLLALPYLTGSRPASSAHGVIAYDTERAQPGLNFYTSGHGPVAILTDMQGRELHRWTQALADVWPDADAGANLDYWRRARLLSNRDVLAIFEGVGLIRVDKSSNLVWAWRGGAHHDVQVTPDSIFVLAREPRVIPRYHETEPVLEDFIVELSMEGRELRRVSLLEAFERSPYAALLDLGKSHGDVFHTNTIDIFDGSLEGRSPFFAADHALVSVRELNTVAIVDLRRERVVWALTGLWRRQHESRLLDNGRILVFDNFREEGRSAVLEIDPLTQEIVWEYSARNFFSRTCGSNQRLANGHTLIVDSDHGRAFEVTPAGESVWEFVNPHRAGDRGQWIATLFDLVRLPQEGWPTASE